MKKIIIIAAAAIALSACHRAAIKQIGYLNMVSTRNVSTHENYQAIKSYAGSGKKELMAHKGKTLDEAITNLVRTVPGGEFIENAKIYVIDDAYYAVEGDIWGLMTGQNFNGFAKGSHVMWQDGFVQYKGTITDLNNDKEATVRQDDTGRIHVVKYIDMRKIE